MGLPRNNRKEVPSSKRALTTEERAKLMKAREDAQALVADMERYTLYLKAEQDTANEAMKVAREAIARVNVLLA